MESIEISLDELLITWNIFNKTLSPMESLLCSAEIKQVLNSSTLKGRLCSIPYLVFSDKKVSGEFKLNLDGKPMATIQGGTECFDITDYVEGVFGVSTLEHPGVKWIDDIKKPYIVYGEILDVKLPFEIPFAVPVNLNGVVFQSRNPPHIAHEEIVKKYAPKLLYTTPYSTAKKTDYAFNKKIKALQEISKRYGVELFVSTLPRLFAGKKEALQNCIIFENMGATEFIMGRGKNCVGSFYDENEPYEYCKKFYDSGQLRVKPVWQDKIIDESGKNISASAIKAKYIDNGKMPPDNLMSRYISEVLL